MRKHLVLLLELLCLLILVSGILSSCVPQKKIKYLQKKQTEDTTSLYLNKRTVDYKIQPKDNIYIRIFSLDEKTFMFFNKQSTGGGYNDYANDASIYLNSYSVTNEGFIDFPIVGRVYVKDLTVEQVKNLLQQLINEYLNETTVVVKMVNFNITIVGEVARPGQYKIYQDEITIFEAFSMAGDLTDFANRNKIALIRCIKGGSKVYYLDLTSDKILNSEFYYLMPGDIIYISPLKIKQWGFSTFPYAVVFAAISTALLLINYFKP
jgi:polysaccharide export outer membrane protein